MGPASAVLIVVICLLLSAAAVRLFMRMAPTLGLVDVPGGRKTHHNVIPLVGGISIFLALLICSAVLHFSGAIAYCLFALSLVIAIGLWDDVAEISPRLKFVVQIVASAVMIWGANIQLSNVGDLIGIRPIGLWIFAIPMTVFAVVGVVNAVNMMDGMDGLAGSLALVAFAWYGLVSYQSALIPQFQLAMALCGAIGGFLLFNLRFPWQPRAKVFLGDAGSLMIGFALAWFAVDLSQGEGRTFPPIAALWVVLLPLVDCVSLMTRRVVARRSPFVADRRHIHHYLEACGFTHGQTLATLVGLNALFGLVGYLGWRAGLAEKWLFLPFFLGFFAYHFFIQRAWAVVDAKAAKAAEAKPAHAAPLDDEEEATSVA
jgi:UDP-GlcNAc:undecaprenyl-phosphate GlcNAc-1-phosphate transferase